MLSPHLFGSTPLTRDERLTVVGELVNLGRMDVPARGSTSDEKQTERRRQRQRAAHAVNLRAAGVQERRQGGGTMLTEGAVVINGARRRSDYELYDQDSRAIGAAVRLPQDPTAGCRARYEFRDPDGRCLFGVQLRAGGADVILESDGRQLARLERSWDGRPASDSNWVVRQVQRSGLAPRWVVADGEVIGRLTYPRQKTRWKLESPRRIVEDRSGSESAVVTAFELGGNSQHAATFVVDVRETAERRLRVIALVTGVVWDWYEGYGP